MEWWNVVHPENLQILSILIQTVMNFGKMEWWKSGKSVVSFTPGSLI